MLLISCARAVRTKGARAARWSLVLARRGTPEREHRRWMVAPAPAMGKAAGPYRCLAPQLVPSWTLSERTLEQCSPSPAAIAAIGPCTHRKSPDATIHLYGEGKMSELGRNIIG